MAVKGTIFKREYKRLVKDEKGNKTYAPTGKEIWCINVTHDEGRIREAIGSKQDAQNALAAVLTDIRRGAYNFKKPKKILFEDFAEDYLKRTEAHKKPRSHIRDKSSLSHLIPYFKGKLLSRITPKDIDNYIQERRGAEIKRHSEKKRPDPGTINRARLFACYV